MRSIFSFATPLSRAPLAALALLLSAALAGAGAAAPAPRSARDLADELAEKRIWTGQIQSLRVEEATRLLALEADMRRAPTPERRVELQMDLEVAKQAARMRYLEALADRAERNGKLMVAMHIRTRIELLRPLVEARPAAASVVNR